MALLLPLASGAAVLRAQRVPLGAEGKRVLAIDLSTASGGRVYDRAPDSAPRHEVLANLRTREGKQFRSADLAKDIEYLTTTSHMFRAADWRVDYDDKQDAVKVRLILTQPLIWRIRVVAPKAGSWSEDGLTDFWRSRPKLDSAEGAEFSLARLDVDVTALAASGAFLDVRADYQYTEKGVDLLFRVIPNQPLAVLRFAGINQTGYTKTLKRVISGAEPVRAPPNNADAETLNLPRYFPQEAFDGDVITDANPAAIKGAVALIEAYYRYQGFHGVTVKPRVVSVPAKVVPQEIIDEYGPMSEAALEALRRLAADNYAGRLALIFDIFEGPRVLIGDVRFGGVQGMRSPDGSDALTAGRFRGILAALYQLWYGVLSGLDTERAAVLRDMIRSKRGEPFVETDALRDAELLQGYLQQRGWLDARVSFSNVEWNHARNRVVLEFHIEPGALYAASDIRIEYATRFPRVPKGVAQPDYDAPVVTFAELLKAMNLKGTPVADTEARTRWGDTLNGLHDPAAGKHFAAFDLAEAMPWDEYLLNGEPGLGEGLAGRIRALLADKGYSNIEVEFVRVETRDTRIDTGWEGPLPARKVGVILRIQQGYKSYVGNVTFRGNDVTREDVIRREVSLYPGEIYDANKLKRSGNRLRRAQWFETAAPRQGVLERTTPRLVTVGDQIIEYTDIDFDLVEGRTNSFNFAAGFSSATGFTASVDLTLRNFDISSLVSWIWGEPNFSFTGAGQVLQFTAQPPLDRQQIYRISFTEPWLYGYPLSGSIGAEYRTDKFADYSRSRAGVDPSIGWRVFPDVVWSFGYSYSLIRLFDVDRDAPDEIRQSAGSDVLSQLWSEIRWTTTDNPQFPTNGFDLSYRYAYTGGILGGTLDFWRMHARAQYYVPVLDLDRTRTLVLAFNVADWWQDVHSNTEEIPFIERFLLGGNPLSGRGVLRGFRFAGVGPSRRGKAIGGNFMTTGFAEIRLPVFPGTLWLIGFVDAGMLSHTLNTFDPDGITVSGGFGLRLLLPVLPVPFALDFGFPILNQPGNREEVISINLGFGF
ncbi:MAG: BamA/TamA family outer membrane protein [Planctomycetes bacterium]|nr:BamA/TamA family outer membrane protein [Planctomycetota bacterium]